MDYQSTTAQFRGIKTRYGDVQSAILMYLNGESPLCENLKTPSQEECLGPSDVRLIPDAASHFEVPVLDETSNSEQGRRG